jgi:hypothetical protein
MEVLERLLVLMSITISTFDIDAIKAIAGNGGAFALTNTGATII